LLICQVEGCERVKNSKGYCQMHYSRLKRLGGVGSVFPRIVKPASSICTIVECGKVLKAKGYCDMHLKRLERTGILGEPKPKTKYSKTPLKIQECRAFECTSVSIRMRLCDYHLIEFGLS
jgi:hypothetical protein